MGLLTRRRKPAGAVVTADGPVPVSNAVPAAGPEPEVGVTERDVIRPADLNDAPAWTTLPPLSPLLSPMPFVVARQFQDDLAAWQAPELALAPLGHAISTTAPAGVVEAIAVLSTEPLVATAAEGAATAGPDATLSLVTPVGAPPDAAPPEPGPFRPAPSALPSFPTRAPGPAATRPAATPPAPPLPPRPTAPRPSPAARSTTTAGPPGPVPDPPSALAPVDGAPPAPPTSAPPAPPESIEAGLLGDAPLGPVATTVPPTEPSSLVKAPSPPELPLAQLAATLLPASRPPAAEAGLTGPGPGTAPVASREEAPPLAVPKGVARPEAVLPGPDTPTSPPTPPAADLIGARRLVPPAEPSAAPEAKVDQGDVHAPLPLVDRPAPPQPVPSVGDQAPPPADAVPGDRGAPLEAATPAMPTAEEPTSPTAPLVGDAAPLVPGPSDETVTTEGVEAAPLLGGPDALPVVRRGDADLPPSPLAPPSPAPPPSRRTGLGLPLQGLPPTASPFDPTSMAQRASMGDAIRARTNRAAAVNRPRRPGPGTTDGGQGPARTTLGRLGAADQGPSLSLAPGSAIARPGTGSGPQQGGTVSDSGYPAPRPLPLVPIERMGSTMVGAGPDKLAPAGAIAPLASLRPSLLEPSPPSSQPQPAPPSSPAAPPPAEGAAVRSAVGQRHALDLSQVPVDRSAASSARARSLRARGYASPSAVVIPPEAGTLNAGPGQALLAHELTHVAQRARLGPNLPAEHTPAGQALEVEARSAELALAPAAPVRATPVEGHAGNGGPAAPHSTATQPGPSVPSALPLAASGPRSGDSLNEATLMAAMQKLSQLGTSTPPSGGPTTVVMTPASVSTPAPAAAVQRAAVAEAPPVASGGGPTGSAFSTKPSDADLSKLVRWIYPLISFRIRGELRENRERAGLLTDSYTRW